MPPYRDIAEEIARVAGTTAPPDRTSQAYADWATDRLSLAAALIEAAFARAGWLAVYVGGGVLQFHLGGAGYQTGDLDMVVAQPSGNAVPRTELADVMRRLGARPGGSRHWVFGEPPTELLVEIPSHEIPVETDRVEMPGDLVLTMDAVEHVIVGRIIEFHNTGNADYALQAIQALRALRDTLDRGRLNRCIAAERVSQAAGIIAALAERPGSITVHLLAFAYDMLRGKHPWCDLRDPRCGPVGRRQ